MDVQIVIPESNLARPQQLPDTVWLRYFNPDAAIAAVVAHIEALPGSRTPERHTWRAYSSGLNYFLEWANHTLPTDDLMHGFIAHLIKHKGLKPVTAASKYLAPVRLYLLKLAGQRLSGYTGVERDYIADCREHLRAAAAVKSPRRETSTNIAPLWNPKFHRLSLQQVNAVLRSIEATTKIGARDYALLHVAFSSGLRLAEIQRITPASIRQAGEVVLITVRGKRSNTDPVPISSHAYADICIFINTYNEGLAEGDPRIIQDG